MQDVMLVIITTNRSWPLSKIYWKYWSLWQPRGKTTQIRRAKSKRIVCSIKTNKTLYSRQNFCFSVGRLKINVSTRAQQGHVMLLPCCFVGSCRREKSECFAPYEMSPGTSSTDWNSCERLKWLTRSSTLVWAAIYSHLLKPCWRCLHFCH